MDKQRFFGDWSSVEDMKRDFWPGYSRNDTYRNELDGVEIIAASYNTGNYEGDCKVLYRQDGKLYEIDFSHCSCYGLEGAWCHSVETTPETLAMQILSKYSSHDHGQYHKTVEEEFGFTYKRR